MVPKVKDLCDLERDEEPRGEWALHILIPDPANALTVLAAMDYPALTEDYYLREDWHHEGHMLAYVYFRCDHPASLVPVAEAIAKQAYATACTTTTFKVSSSMDYRDVQTTIDFDLVEPNG